MSEAKQESYLGPVMQSAVLSIKESDTTSSLRGRCWKVITKISDGTSKVFAHSDGVDKVSKMFIAFTVTVMVVCNDATMPVVSGLNKAFTNVCGLISPCGAVDRLNVFVNGTYRKQGPFKRVSTACLVVSKSAEALKWLRVRGVVELGQLARTIGGSRLYQVTSLVTITTFKSFFVVIASVCAIIDAGLSIADSWGQPKVKQLLTIVNDTGKICVTLFAAYWFSYPFAIIAIITGVSGVAKFVFNQYYK